MIASQDNRATVDKIIPELGYVVGNVAIISMRANRIKNNLAVEEMEMLVSRLEKIMC